MAGSIDPRCETIRGTHWPVKVAGVFGTRVAENHLGQRSPAASTGRTYGCKRSDQTVKNLLWHGGRPHMGPGLRRDDILLLHGHLARDEIDHERAALIEACEAVSASGGSRFRKGGNNRSRFTWSAQGADTFEPRGQVPGGTSAAGPAFPFVQWRTR